LFQNLISNSLKYKSEHPPRIHIGSEDTEDEWVITVRDNGIGIEPQYHTQVFGVFKRLHGRDIPGTGIGLAICRKIVETHGGRIWIESDGKAGSAFRFTLPK
jgi:light-regulated signal transduction histidine kinase (bacteriophytochrome)